MGEAGINKTAKLVTSEEMRLLEDRASQQGIDNAILMETAGLEIALAVSREIGFLRQIPILILVGPGNNGLDGLIAGTHLSSFGAKVTATWPKGSLMSPLRVWGFLNVTPPGMGIP